MSEIETVLIVGGGIAGLTLGRALHREGLTVELIERSTEWRAEGGGIAASPTACAYCAPLASMAQLERSGQRLRRWSFCDEAGDLLSRSAVGRCRTVYRDRADAPAADPGRRRRGRSLPPRYVRTRHQPAR